MNTNDVLKSINGGVNPVVPGVTPVAVYNPSPVGSLQPVVTPTAPTTPIDLTNIVNGACGIMAIDIDNTATSAVDTLVIIGLDEDSDNTAVVKVVNQISSSALSASDSSNTIKIAPSRYSGQLNGNKFIPWLNEQFCCQNILFGNIAVTDLGSSGTTFNTFRKQALSVTADNIGGNFANSNYSLKPDLCNPCFNSNDDIGLWEGKFPASANTGFYFIVPKGVKAQMEFQVIATAKTGDFAACATM